jgi:hypothetical protein
MMKISWIQLWCDLLRNLMLLTVTSFSEADQPYECHEQSTDARATAEPNDEGR